MENWTLLLLYGTGISLLIFAGSLVVAWFLIVRMPPDYLTRPRCDAQESAHPALRLAWRIGRNLLGMLFLIAGVIMLVTPGQGLLFIFLGLLFLDFPGKHQLIERLLRQPRIYRSINAIRARAGKVPIEVPVDRRDEESPDTKLG